MKCIHTLVEKIAVTIFALSFALVAVYVPQNWESVKRAEAGATAAFQTVQIALQTVFNALSAAADAIQQFFAQQGWFKEYVLDGIAWVVAKRVISQITQSVVSWINSGFEGKPAFVQSLDDFLLNTVATEVAAVTLQKFDIEFERLCEPFNIDTRLALQFQFNSEKFQATPICTVTDAFNNLGTSFEQFTDDFNQGGWDAWFEVTVNNQTNTPYGVYYSAKARLDLELAEAELNERQKLDFGQGFLSYETCEQVPFDDDPSQTYELCSIATPGDTIADALTFQIGTGQESLLAADEMNEIFSALIAKISEKAIVGAGGLLGLSQPGSGGSGGGGNSYLDVVRDEITTNNTLRGLAETALETELRYQCATDPVCNLEGENALDYERRLRDFARTSAPEQNQATFAEEAANTIRDDRPRVTNNIVELRAIIAAIDELDDELASTNSETSQRDYDNAISELTRVYQSLDLTPEPQIQGDIDQWNALMRVLYYEDPNAQRIALEGDVDLNDDGYIDRPIQCSGGIIAQCTYIPCAGDRCPDGGIDLDGDGNAGDRLRCQDGRNCEFVPCTGANCIDSADTDTTFDLNNDRLTGDTVRCISSGFSIAYCDIIVGNSDVPRVGSGLDLNGDGIAGDNLYCFSDYCYISPCDGGSCATPDLGALDLDRDGKFGDALQCPTFGSTLRFNPTNTTCRILQGDLDMP